MTVALITLATLMPLLMLAVFLLGRCWQRLRGDEDAMSAVSMQHFEIFQTGEFNEAAVETVKRRFRVLFEHGGELAVEATLRPGPHYIYQVRALAEIGTDAAGRILERQLRRRLSDDQLEQAWYWIDLAASLRLLNRQESLPNLLRCSEAARESPLGHYFAAETMCILGFAGYLRQAETSLGRSALRLVHRAVEGLRFGVQPHLVLEARLGELLETAWDHRPDTVAPLLVRILHEALRLMRRADHLRTLLLEESAEREAFDWQFSRIAALEPAMREYLKDAAPRMRACLATARGDALADLLHALYDLRIDAATELLPILKRSAEHRPLMIDALRWSRDPAVARWLRDEARTRVAMQKRSRSRLQVESPVQPSIAADIAYVNILRSLRGHASVETEELLMLACQDWDPLMRMAAVSSLGWWEPLKQGEVRDCLAKCKRDPSPEVRQTARAALARLGERGSLHWFRQALLADDPQQVAQAAHFIADEGLTLLWPELDRLLDVDHEDVVLHAHAAVERLAEEMEHARTRSA